MRMWSRHSLRTLRTHRSAIAFARGARTGVLMTRTPSPRTISSNGPENFASRSCNRNRTSCSRSSTVRLRACWRIQTPSGLAVTPASRTRRDPCSMKNNTYSVRSQAVSTVKKSQANIPCAWARRNSPHDGPPRRGAGPQPERRRTDLIVVAPTRMPSLRSSPWIRIHPQLGFSRPRRTTSSRSAESSGGRPGRSEEHTSELQSHHDLVCRLLLEKKKKKKKKNKYNKKKKKKITN